MTPKKLHEVDRLSRVVFTVAERSHVDTIIDIGAGHGYLTHLVATQNPSRRVVAIDCEDARTCGSKDRGSRILSSVHHQVPAAMLNFGGYHHRLKLDPTWTSKVEYATARLDPATLSETCGGGKGSRYALVGLHSCGDLSGVTMLTTFLECGDVKAVVVVACCYQRITTGSGPNDAAAGIPLSQTVKDLTSHRNPPFTLTHRVLSSAQLTFASFADSTTIISSFKGHYHRSLFELALRRWSTMHPASFDRLGLNEPASFSSGPSFRVGGLPKACTRNFRAYCLAAAGKMGLLVGEDVEQDLGLGRSLDGLILELQEEFPVERMLPRIALMCVLRSVLGPCVEALVLLDRVKYLEEGLGCGPNGEAKGKVWLRNIFENDLSPRNAAIVAEKTDGGQI
ncbi:methyltransferase domain-containing protein [Fimicolochytrium jonesii]|uniref:methyltransferase domain-containing protein n=1 Tax=Fimicolochytrium jonesii TaxID=1396493 RepID=UPI0022FE5B9E|nr:methyltransferase domain-containing protein [Fimicolochytrium jonesii]KAI8817122.1 methyltransferase domain-containing protein [Fimicolochytrium jonesii]